MATIYNLAIDQGTTFNATIAVTDDNGNSRDLSNCTARAQLRRSYFSTSNVEFTVSINNPLEGEIVFSLSADKTANLKYGRYVYDVEMLNADSETERVLEGTVTVYPEVTR